MSDLPTRDAELVALGAALGSNCVPCIEHHIPKARQAGLSDPEIHAAIQRADKVRQVPARKVLEAALNLLPQSARDRAAPAASADCGCGGASAMPRPDPAAAGRTAGCC